MLEYTVIYYNILYSTIIYFNYNILEYSIRYYADTNATHTTREKSPSWGQTECEATGGKAVDYLVCSIGISIVFRKYSVL